MGAPRYEINPTMAFENLINLINRRNFSINYFLAESKN